MHGYKHIQENITTPAAGPGTAALTPPQGQAPLLPLPPFAPLPLAPPALPPCGLMALLDPAHPWGRVRAVRHPWPSLQGGSSWRMEKQDVSMRGRNCGERQELDHACGTHGNQELCAHAWMSAVSPLNIEGGSALRQSFLRATSLVNNSRQELEYLRYSTDVSSRWPMPHQTFVPGTFSLLLLVTYATP